MSEKNGLNKIPDSPGKFMLISKSKLLIDPEYQRDLKQSKAEEIGNNWRWTACGTLTVEQRNGKYYVPDGQHRLTGARLRPDVDKLPCMVYSSEGSQHEAKTFLTVNTNRKPLTALDRHKARVHSGDKHAILIEELAHSVGREVGHASDRHTVKCVNTLYRYAKRNSENLKACWNTIADLQEGRVIDGRLTIGLLMVAESGLDLNDRAVRLRFMNIGATDLILGINRWIEVRGKSGPNVYAAAVANIYNKGLRSRRIKLS